MRENSGLKKENKYVTNTYEEMIMLPASNLYMQKFIFHVTVNIDIDAARAALTIQMDTMIV